LIFHKPNRNKLTRNEISHIIVSEDSGLVGHDTVFLVVFPHVSEGSLLFSSIIKGFKKNVSLGVNVGDTWVPSSRLIDP
jgi:hypothetical protein